MYFSDLTHTLQNISTDEKAVFVSGQPGSGKTFTALQFCAEHKESLYFSFKNLDTAFALRVFCNAHTEIFGDSESWKDFFGCLTNYGNKKHPLVFFDNAEKVNCISVMISLAILIIMCAVDNWLMIEWAGVGAFITALIIQFVVMIVPQEYAYNVCAAEILETPVEESITKK